MRKLDRYVQPPGCCFVCRSAKRDGDPEWILDLDRDITDGPVFEARLYLCPQCCFEIAKEAGCATPAMVDRFITERDAAIRQCAALIEENGALRGANEALMRVPPPAPGFVLAATSKYACPICLEEGVPPTEASKQNPQGLARHLQTKHGQKYSNVMRGDAALEETPT
jgi:hypothetical protein